MLTWDKASWTVAVGLALLLYVLQETKTVLPSGVLHSLAVIAVLCFSYGLIAVAARFKLTASRRPVVSLVLAVTIGAAGGATVGACWWFLAARSSLESRRPMEEHIAADGAFTAVRIPGSGSPNARQAVFKTVGERERHVVLGVRPMRVLIEPPGVTVSDVDVPITLTTDKGPVLVTRFTDDGVVLDERKGPGLELRVTVIDGERSSVAEDPNLRRTRRIRHATELIQKQMNVADALEQRMRGETAWSKPTFDAFVKDMYDWRSDAARALAQILPKSGASTRFLEANGETGQSPVRYEYTKLLSLKSNLALILDRLDSWIDRSDFDTRN